MIWFPIPDSHCSVSDEGQVRSDITGLTLAVYKNRGGYLQVNIIIAGRKRVVEVQRLVAAVFVLPFAGEQVNHIDGDKTNNHYTNLEWCTVSENVRHSLRTNPRKQAKTRVRLTATQVVNIRHIGNYFPTTKLAALYGVDRTTIGRVLRRRTHQAL